MLLNVCIGEIHSLADPRELVPQKCLCFHSFTIS